MDENTIDRQAMIERIAGNLERFDDDTLTEFDRLTNPETDLVVESPTREGRSLTRRELITAGVAGAALIAVAGGATVVATRGGSPSAPDNAGLQALLEAHEGLEAVGIDGVAKAGLQTVGASIIEAGTAAAGLRAGIDVIEGTLSVPVPGLDTGFHSVLRQNVLEPATAAVTAMDDLTETWRLEMATPIQARLDERDQLRRQILTLRAAGEAGGDA